ncbi:MAG: TetR/AcrR family transcriptional regulator [Thermoanaerobaculia bacterium]
MPRLEAGRRRPSRRTPHDRLLLAATKLFARRGYAATAVREIVESAGVTKPVLYYHFGNKEGIYRALVAQISREFEERIDRVRAKDGPARIRVVALCLEIEDLVRKRFEAVRFFYNVFYGPPQSAPQLDVTVFERPFREFLEGTLRESVAAGEIDEHATPEVAIAIEAIVNFVIEAAISQPHRLLSESDLTRLIDMFYRGAAPAAAAH